MMSDLLSLASLDILLGLCGAVLIFQYARTKKRKPLPPGPKPLPLIGNLFDMPTADTELGDHWSKHKTLYGPISSVSALGTTLIIINDCEIAFELLDRRSFNYSNRPSLPFTQELCGLGRTTTLSFYGDTHRLHRKWMHNFMGSRSGMQHIENIQEIETHRLLYRILEKPDKFLDYLRAVPGAVMLKISYDYDITSDGPDDLVELADIVVKTIFSESSQAGRWLVDIVPALQYLPEWVPGAGFQKKARVWKTYVNDFYEKGFKFVKHQIAMGNAGPSFVYNILENDEDTDKENRDSLKYAAATFYGAGSDTSVSTLGTFFLAMMLYPAVLKRAQEELKRVVGDDRLPGFADRPNLPYINAIVKETLRWETVVPTAVPHVTEEEDEYMGYCIPKGSIIVPNVWQMHHDADKYKDPFTFKPERFLGEDGSPVAMDPHQTAFGFGRRICPGKDVADNMLFITIAMSAAVFNISKMKDEFGKEIEPVRDYTVGIIRHPNPFECSITPRSQKAIALIQSVLDEHPFPKGDVDILKTL